MKMKQPCKKLGKIILHNVIKTPKRKKLDLLKKYYSDKSKGIAPLER